MRKFGQEKSERSAYQQSAYVNKRSAFDVLGYYFYGMSAFFGKGGDFSRFRVVSPTAGESGIHTVYKYVVNVYVKNRSATRHFAEQKAYIFCLHILKNKTGVFAVENVGSSGGPAAYEVSEIVFGFGGDFAGGIVGIAV